MRQTIDLNLGWRFHLGEADNASYQGYDDRAWREVTLPHDWSVGLPFDERCSSGTGYLPGGVGWYRKRFTLPEGIGGKRVFVTFGGVYKHARCWINSHYLGMRAYGYASFTHELTGRVKPGENVLCVRAEHVDLADSRWFTGAGIYRDVTLTITDAALISDVFARTTAVAGGCATIDVDATIDRVGERAATLGMRVELRDAEGATVAEACADAADGACRLSLRLPEPRLWSPESPYLYTLVATLTEGGAPTDEVRLAYGVRTFRFDADRGFALNGEPRKLKGVCLHHDMGALGAAVPISAWERRLKKLQEAGANALRTSHNPPDPKLLDLCDRMGVIVIDEAFDEWEGCKNKWWQGHNVYPPRHYGYSEDFAQWHERDLGDMVRRDRNHACVILWSIGNEIDYPNDPYVHPSFASMTGNNDADKPDAERAYDPMKPDAGRLPVIARELDAIVRRLDGTRPTTLALAYPELSNLTGLSDTVGVAGYNYMEHRYLEDHAAYPKRVIMGSENSHEPEAWLAVKRNDFISGQFLWTGADFLGECKGWPVRISQAGLLDTANHEKPLWYLRRALWTDALCGKLAASLTGNIWDESLCWRYAEGEEVAVSLYTNAERATLYLNGRELSTVEVGERGRATWRVPFEPGELRAACLRGNERVEDALYTTGEAARMALRCDRTELRANGEDVAIVDVELYDERGRVADGARDVVTIQLVGDATLLGIENGCPDDLTPFPSRARPVYRGRAVAYLRAGVTRGEVALTAWTRGGLRATATLRQS